VADVARIAPFGVASVGEAEAAKQLIDRLAVGVQAEIDAGRLDVCVWQVLSAPAGSEFRHQSISSIDRYDLIGGESRRHDLSRDGV
jgi:hypothetical protein